MSDFTIKDSGKREEFSGGMVRDTTEGKTDYSLVLDGPMFKRWAVHLTKGAIKYAKRNWMKAEGPVEQERFRESALRHFIQWYYGDRDEDHASAVFFNINGAEYVREKPEPRQELGVEQLMPGQLIRIKDRDGTFEDVRGEPPLVNCSCVFCEHKREEGKAITSTDVLKRAGINRDI